MWNEQKRLFQSQLSPGESLLWSGQPRQGIFFRPSDIYVIPSSLLMAGFAIFWFWGVWRTNAPFFFPIMGGVFLVYAAYWMVGRFFVDAWQRSKTYYAVTNERAIILSGIFSTDVKSVSIRSVPEISISERRDLSGTITFGPIESVSDWQSKLPFKTSREDKPIYPVFDSVSNVKSVYDIIRNVQRTSAKAS